jgi:hypothetical protein
MTKYQQFLESIGIIPEDLFNEIIDSLPEVDIDSIDFDLNGADSLDDVAEQIISYILQDWEYVYVEELDFENKTLTLYDVESLKDLEEIKETFSKWTITNYDDLVEQLKEEENEDNKEFESLINKIRSNATIEQLRKFVDSL